MRIQCHQCSTRYAIGEEKILGADRVFKIRCKQCSGIITIHGIAADGSSGDVASQPDAGEAVWYYVQEGEQVGPVDQNGLLSALADSKITEESYVWKAGMADWLPMNSVDELRTVSSAEQVPDDVVSRVADDVAPDATIEEAAALPAREAAEAAEETIQADSPFAAGDTEDPDAALAAATAAAGLAVAAPGAHEPTPDDPGSDQLDATFADMAMPASLSDFGDPTIADIDPTTESDPVFTSAAPIDEPAPNLEEEATLGDLFGNDDSREKNAGGDLFGAAEDEMAGLGQEGAADDDDMVWQRHDNSVLFSLSELEDDAGEKPTPKDEKTAALAAITADSGLIDIRSFSKKKRDLKKKSGDLFADLAGDTPLPGPMPNAKVASATVAATALPVIQRKKKSSAGLLVGGLLGAALVAGGTAFAVMHFMGTKEQPKTAEPTNQQVAVAPAAGATGGTAAEGAPGAAAKSEVAAKAASPEVAKAAKPAVAQPAVAPEAAKPAVPAAAAVGPDGKPVAGQPAAVVAAKPAEPVPAVKAEPAKPAKPLTPAQRERLRKQREERKAKAAERKVAAVAKAAAAKAAAPKPAAKPAAKPKVDPNDLLGSINATAPAKPKPAAPKESAGSDADLPNAPTNTQIKRVMRKAAAPVRRCVTSTGQSNVHVATSFKIKPSGGVSGVSLKGPVASTAAAGCVKSAISGLKFPASKQGKRVNYPFFVK